MLLPIPLLLSLFFGVLSLALLAGSVALLYRAWRRYLSIRRKPQQPRVTVGPGVAVAADERPYGVERSPLAQSAVWVPLLAGCALLLFTFAGKNIVSLAFRSGDEPKELHSADIQSITRPDGTKLHVEIFGPPDAPVLVLTHGWSTSSTEWYYAKRQLAGQFRLIIWDLAGLGQSSQPDNRDYSLDKMAADLESVVALAGNRPVVLVGHSIGGMINLTFCRLFPNELGSRVAGIVQVDTSYTNPVKTTKNARLSEALQKPVAEPLLHVMIWFSPVFRAMSWLSYRSGMLQMMNAQSAFAGSETWGQVDLVSSYSYRSAPAVVARGTLGMFHWDATPVLPQVKVPVLILEGEQDTTTLPSASLFMHNAIARSTLDLVNPSAHYGLLEQNQRYDTSIARFSDSVLRP